jgi:signal peptidase I
MLPTFNISGDLALAEKISHKLGKVGAGDIVLVTSPVEPRKIVTKRVIGVEGDSVTYVVDPQNSDRTETIVVCVCFFFIFWLDFEDFAFSVVKAKRDVFLLMVF